MRIIQQLPDHIIAKIAAGEVIERPAYAVKELLENAIDAKSNDIQLFLEDAGLKKIMIIDNGHGMSPEDIRESYKHHTTSKLHETLIGIKSFGFRGEALSSIAAISSMIIKSKHPDATTGIMLELHQGNVLKESSVGMPQGTTIIISDLFHSVPARKKFLKSKRTEFRHTLEIVLQTAIIHPSIRFQLTHNNKMVLDFPKISDMRERIRYLFGNDIVTQMLPVKAAHSFITVAGYIGSPHIINTTPGKQYLFVNNRSIHDRRISQTVKDAYGSLLDNNSYPLFVLSITLPHEMVDVNVHPRKEQIAFINNESIFAAIKQVIRDVLQKSNLTYTPIVWKKDLPNMPTYATTILRDSVIPWQKNQTEISLGNDITQIHNIYIIAQTNNGFIMVDQHAAHERILYEEYLDIFNKEKNTNLLQLPEAIVITPPLTIIESIFENKKKINELGIRFEEFGKGTIKITHIPLMFKDHNIHTLFLDLVNELQNYRTVSVDRQSQRMIAYLACRNAIMAGDKLTKKQCKYILEKLEKTSNNYTCPHGRPTKVELSLKDLNRLFKRT